MLWVSIVDADAVAQDAAEIIKGAIDHWRGQSSYSEMTMTTPVIDRASDNLRRILRDRVCVNNRDPQHDCNSYHSMR